MKFAIREAIDVYFKAKSTFKLGSRTIRAGEPVLILDTVKTSTLEVAAEMSYVTGGRGNSRILSYEGDKVLTFSFEDALLSAEGLAILSGADMIPARNKHLPGSSPEARSVIAHYTEKYSVMTNNIRDGRATNVYPEDASIGAKPRGGVRNVFLTRKPYVGQNASIYVMLLDQSGEMSGAPLQINLNTEMAADTDNTHAYLAKFAPGTRFIAFDKAGSPMNVTDFIEPTDAASAGVFDDQVMHYVDAASAQANWVTSWGAIADYERGVTIDGKPGGASTAVKYGSFWGDVAGGGSPYCYLLAPSGGVAQPLAYKEGSQLVYKLNVPSILYQDIVLLDYYVEYAHNATQVSILPDKFAPYMSVEGSSLVRRASDGSDLPVEFVIPRFKITTALTFTLQSTGDASTFTFQGDAYPDFSKFDLTRKVLADIQILDADDNYDIATNSVAVSDPTSYRRYKYSETEEGEYLWKDPSMEPHSNINYADTGDYDQAHGGPASLTPGKGIIDNDPVVPPTP